MKDLARLYVYIITAMLIGCISIMLCYATYYVINDRELLFEWLGHMKIIVLAVGFYWLLAKLTSNFWEK